MAVGQSCGPGLGLLHDAAPDMIVSINRGTPI